MRLSISKTLILAASLIAVFSGTALAVDNLGDDNRGGLTKQTLKTRLDNTKLKACENRERAINNILDRIAARGERRLNVYDAISERVQAFYAKKNLSVDNYEDLIAGVSAKHDSAATAVEQVKLHDVDFTCDGSDPKSAAAGIKDDLKAEIKALHAYQQSIKDLIVAIKTSIGGSTDDGGSE